MAPVVGLHNRCVDHQPGPVLGRAKGELVHSEYVDNVVGLSRDRATALVGASEVATTLTASGFRVHPPEASCGGDTLGWTFGVATPVIGIHHRL